MKPKPNRANRRPVIIADGRPYKFPSKLTIPEYVTAVRHFDLPDDMADMDIVNEPEHMAATLFTLMRRAEPELSIEEAIERTYAVRHIEAY